jgi:hypothetical protein
MYNVLYYTVLYYTVLYCTVPYCTGASLSIEWGVRRCSVEWIEIFQYNKEVLFLFLRRCKL